MGSTWSWLQWPSRGSRGIGPSGKWHPHCDEIVKGRGRVRNSHPSHTHMKLLHCSISLPLWHSISFLTGAECIGCQSPNSQLRYRRPTKQPGKFDTRSNVVIYMKNYWVLRSSLIETFFLEKLQFNTLLVTLVYLCVNHREVYPNKTFQFVVGWFNPLYLHQKFLVALVIWNLLQVSELHLTISGGQKCVNYL